MRRRSQGFTIIELLIAIVVIGILAALVSGYAIGVSREAEATSFVSTVRTIERGFIAKGAADGISEWWPEIELEGCAGLYLSLIHI